MPEATPLLAPEDTRGCELLPKSKERRTYKCAPVSPNKKICKCAMRGKVRGRISPLVSSCTKWMYAAMFDISTMRILEAPRVNIAYSRTSIYEYAIRGSPRAHPALLLSPSMKWMHAAMVDTPIVGVSEARG